MRILRLHDREVGGNLLPGAIERNDRSCPKPRSLNQERMMDFLENFTAQKKALEVLNAIGCRRPA